VTLRSQDRGCLVAHTSIAELATLNSRRVDVFDDLGTGTGTAQEY